jgi:toxin ParE1/3/4
MAKATYSPEAEGDLGRIVEYIARDNLLAALDWLEQTQATCNLLASHPDIGEAVRTRRFPEARRHVQGNFLIY